MANIKIEITKSDNTKYTLYNYTGLLSLESTSQSTPNNKTINYGIFANTGTIKINDINGEIAEMIESGAMDSSNVPISIFFNNGKIQEHLSSDSEYDTVNKQLTIQLTNSLQMLDMLQYQGRKLTQQMSAYALLEEVLNELNYTNIQNMMTASTKTKLESIIIKYPYLQPSTYREAINKICQLGQLNAYCDKNGNLRFEYLTPFLSSSDIDNVAIIPQHYQFSKMSYSLFKENKIDKVIAKRYKIKINEPQLVQTFNIMVFDENGTPVWQDTNNYNQEMKSAELSSTTGTGDRFLYTNKQYSITNKNIVPQFIGNNEFYAKITKNYKNGFTETLKTDVTQTLLFSTEGMAYSYINNGLDLNVLFSIQYHWYSSGSIRRQDVYSFNIDFYAKTYEFETEENIYGTGTSEYELQTNELFTDETTISNTPIDQYIANDILSKYQNGITSTTLTIACADFYNSSGTKIKNWQNGEVVGVGDRVKIKPQMKTWLVTGAKPRYSTAPYIDLELFRTPIYYQLTFAYYNATGTIKRGNETLTSGDIVEDADVLNIEVTIPARRVLVSKIYENSSLLETKIYFLTSLNSSSSISYNHIVNGNVEIQNSATRNALVYDFNNDIDISNEAEYIVSYFSYIELSFRIITRKNQQNIMEMVFVGANNHETVVYDENNGWYSQDYLSISIDGGRDANNTDFREWLNKNGSFYDV